MPHTIQKPSLSKKFNPHSSLLVSRNPTDRIVSHYNYFERKKTNIPIEDLKTDELSLFANRLKNVVTHWTCGHPSTDPLNSAIKNLEEITYAGTTSNLKKLLQHVAKMECKKRRKDIYIPQIPHHRSTHNIKTPKNTKDLIREICEDSLDLKLHKHIIEKEKQYYL